MTIEKLISGICQMLDAEFELPVYTERVEQDLDSPCFFVRSHLNRNDKRLMWRYRHGIDIEVVYFPSETEATGTRTARAEMNDISDRLMYLLRVIETSDEKVLTTGRESTIVDSTLVMTFSVTIYEREVIDPDLMEAERTVFKEAMHGTK